MVLIFNSTVSREISRTNFTRVTDRNCGHMKGSVETPYLGTREICPEFHSYLCYYIHKSQLRLFGKTSIIIYHSITMTFTSRSICEHLAATMPGQLRHDSSEACWLQDISMGILSFLSS